MQSACVRIPFPLVLFLCLAVIVGVWCFGTWNADFVSPPPESKLTEIRLKIESSLPSTKLPKVVVPIPKEPVKPTPPAEPPKPVIELGDLGHLPVLQEYGDAAVHGAPYLIELARQLEMKGELQRSLLAWERVIDLGKADDAQIRTAVASIKRLRPAIPDWKPKTGPICITLHAETTKKNAKTLKLILEETARDIEHASAGILRVTAEVTVGHDQRDAKQPPSVAVRITGSNKKPRSTEVMTVAMQSADTLRQDIQKVVFNLVRSYLGHGPSQTPPSEMTNGESALDALTYRITRLFWADLGTLLNHPPA